MMSQQEINLSIVTLIITSVINVMSIVVNCYYMYKQNNENKKIKEFDVKRETITGYYLPIKFFLIKFEATNLKIKNINPQFDIFNLYIQDSAMKREREYIVKLYKEYLLLHQKLKVQYADPVIDCKLAKLYNHMQVVIIFDNDPNISRHSNEYELPSVSGLIREIDSYAQKYKMYA